MTYLLDYLYININIKNFSLYLFINQFINYHETLYREG